MDDRHKSVERKKGQDRKPRKYGTFSRCRRGSGDRKEEGEEGEGGEEIQAREDEWSEHRTVWLMTAQKRILRSYTMWKVYPRIRIDRNLNKT